MLCAQFCQNNHRECRALSQNQAHVRAHCGAQTDATMKISMCARVMIFFQPLLLVNFVVDRNEAYTAKSCLRCTRKSVSEFNLRYLNSIPKRVTVYLLNLTNQPCMAVGFLPPPDPTYVHVRDDVPCMWSCARVRPAVETGSFSF